MRKIGLFIMILSLCCIAAPVKASSMTVSFGDSGIGNFNKLEAFILTPGIGFEAPGLSNFGDGNGHILTGWSGAVINPNYALATGTDANFLAFDISFLSNVPFNFDFLAWDDSTLRQRDNVAWNGNDWNVRELPLQFVDTYDRTSTAASVPEPATMLLLGIGLIGLTGARRKA